MLYHELLAAARAVASHAQSLPLDQRLLLLRRPHGANASELGHAYPLSLPQLICACGARVASHLGAGTDSFPLRAFCGPTQELTSDALCYLVPALIQLGLARDVLDAGNGLGRALLFSNAETVAVSTGEPVPTSLWSLGDLKALTHLRVSLARLESDARSADEKATKERAVSTARLAVGDRSGAMHHLQRSKAAAQCAARRRAMSANAEDLLRAILSAAATSSFTEAMAMGTSTLKALHANLTEAVPGSESPADSVARVLQSAADALDASAEVDAAIVAGAQSEGASDAELEAELAALTAASDATSSACSHGVAPPATAVHETAREQLAHLPTVLQAPAESTDTRAEVKMAQAALNPSDTAIPGRGPTGVDVSAAAADLDSSGPGTAAGTGNVVPGYTQARHAQGSLIPS